jgi:hypothetical protein
LEERRARLPGRRRINTAAKSRVAVLTVSGQDRHLAQHRHTPVGGGVVARTVHKS